MSRRGRMAYLKFNHVFFGLMALSFISAFLLPPTVGGRVQKSVQGIFVPISYPVYHTAGWAHDKLWPKRLQYESVPTTQSTDQIKEENRQLKSKVASLTGQLERMQELAAERAKLGNIRDLCTRYSVSGPDSGPRQSLLLSGTSRDGLKDGMAVLYTEGMGGIVGKIVNSGVGGSRVLLVTDRESRLTTVFARIVRKPDDTMEFQRRGDPVTAVGTGDGAIVIRNQSEKAIKEWDVRVDDWLVLSDRDWPRVLEHARIGRVVSISPSRSPGFVEIKVMPDQTLMALRDVMVMDKEK